MPTWKLTIEYEGTGFCGWQRQPNGVSIQATVEDALTRLHGGERTHAIASGRTDAGVHARGQVISFRVDAVRTRESYERGLNSLLPDTIAVKRAEEAPDAFDARRWARGKRYVYRVLSSRQPSPLRRGQVWQVYAPLDVDAMRAAARPLLGTHDFSSFRASDCDARHAVRELRRLDVDERGDEVVFTLEATAFLKHMVRNLVGTLVEVGSGRRPASSITGLLAACDRTRAGRTAPAQGLFLDEVFYDLAAGPPSKDVDGD